MKLQKRDFVFFGLGGIVFLLGSFFTPFRASRVDAQPPFQDWIRCGRLDIIDEKTGRPCLVLSTGDGSGIVNIYGKDGGGFASLFVNSDGGELVIEGESGTGRLVVNEKAVQFSVIGEDLKSEARLSADEHGGVVSLFNKAGQEVGTFRVSEQGEGVLKTYNIQGEETGSVP